ncbi:type IV secretion system protein, partial [Patescibacteria group bacterium]|nr:type IV secretion system protein [Patescibacteria group bacterium]
MNKIKFNNPTKKLILSLTVIFIISFSLGLFSPYSASAAGDNNPPTTGSGAEEAITDPDDAGTAAKIAAVEEDAVDDGLNKATTWLLQAITWLVYWVVVMPNGWLSGVIMNVMIQVAGMGGGIISLPAVVQGWEVVLNLTNMFFVLMLLIIAFATVLKIESYSYKKLLPTLVIVAILVNFSRIICGLAIDASQVVMKTFVDAISANAEGGIAVMFQMNKMMELQSQPEEFQGQSINVQLLLAMIMAGAMLTVLVIVLLIYTVVIISRIVIFWIATILSPIAFACAVLPATKKYFQQWLEMFSRYLIIGPIIMFFLWLALFISASATNPDSGIVGEIGTAVKGDFEEKMNTKNDAMTEALNPAVFANFIIATLLLLKGMELAQSMSQEFSKATGKAADVGKWLATAGPTRWATKQLARAGKPVSKLAGGMVADRVYQATGVDLNLKRVWEKMRSEAGDISKERQLLGRAKAKGLAEKGSMFGWLGASDYMYRQYVPLLGEQQNWLVGAQYKNRRGYKNFERNKQDFQEKDQEYFQLQGEMAKQVADFEKTNMTEKKEAEINDKIQKIDAVDESVTNNTFKASDSRSKDFLQNFMGVLENEGDYDGMNQVRNILNNTGNLEGDIKDRFQDYLGKEKRDREEDLARADIMPKAQYDAALKATISGIQAEVDKAKEERQAARDAMGEFALVVDYGAIQAQRAYMDEEVKKIDTNNEDDLKSLLVSKLTSGDATGYLAVISQAAKVGHLNEMMDKVGLDQSPQGMRTMFEALIGDEQSEQWAQENLNMDKAAWNKFRKEKFKNE